MINIISRNYASDYFDIEGTVRGGSFIFEP